MAQPKKPGKNPTEDRRRASGDIKASIFMSGELNSTLKRLADDQQRETKERTSISMMAVALIREGLKARKVKVAA